MARKRRGNREGSIYQQANGMWCATYSAGYNEEGRRKVSVRLSTSSFSPSDSSSCWFSAQGDQRWRTTLETEGRNSFGGTC
jgi:hypothetical protein